MAQNNVLTLESLFGARPPEREQYVTTEARPTITVDEWNNMGKPSGYNVVSTPEKKAVAPKAGTKIKVPKAVVSNQRDIDVEGRAVQRPAPEPVAQEPVVQRAALTQAAPTQPRQDVTIERTVERTEPAMRQPSGGMDWSDLLIGATPILAGLLTGRPLEGAKLGGEHMYKSQMDKRKKELDLMSKIKEKEITRKADAEKILNKNQVIEGFDPKTGVSYGPMTYNKAIENGLDVRSLEPKEEKELSKSNVSKFITPEGEEKFTTYKKGIENGWMPEEKAGEEDSRYQRHRENLALREEQALRGVRKEFSGAVKKEKDNLAGLQKLQKTLNTKGWAGALTSQAFFIRSVLGEVGNLNEQEQVRASVSPQLMNRVNQMFNKLSKGDPLTSEDRRSLLEVAEKMRVHYEREIEDKAQEIIGSEKRAFGKDVRPLINPMIKKATKIDPDLKYDTSDVKVMLDGRPASIPRNKLEEYKKKYKLELR